MARPVKKTEKPVPGFSSGFQARLEALISANGGFDNAVTLSGGSKSQLNSWRFGRSRPDFFALSRLCEAVNKPLEWLAKGDLPHSKQVATALSDIGTEQERGGRMLVDGMEMRVAGSDLISLPRLNIAASAGAGLVPVEEEVEGFIAIKREYLRHIDVSPAHAHIAMLSGHSMKPTLLDRDLIIVDTSKTEVINEMIYAIVYGDAVLAKRIQLLWDGSLRIISDNKVDGYVDEIVPASERNTLRIVGRIKGYLRHF